MRADALVCAARAAQTSVAMDLRVAKIKKLIDATQAQSTTEQLNPATLWAMPFILAHRRAQPFAWRLLGAPISSIADHGPSS
jgi:hypothetical protein